MCIVNTEGCNIFENLSSKDYTTVLDLVRDIILATDLAHHLKIMNSLKEMAKGIDRTIYAHKEDIIKSFTILWVGAINILILLTQSEAQLESHVLCWACELGVNS